MSFIVWNCQEVEWVDIFNHGNLQRGGRCSEEFLISTRSLTRTSTRSLTRSPTWTRTRIHTRTYPNSDLSTRATFFFARRTVHTLTLIKTSLQRPLSPQRQRPLKRVPNCDKGQFFQWLMKKSRMVMEFVLCGALIINCGNRILILFHLYCCRKHKLCTILKANGHFLLCPRWSLRRGLTAFLNMLIRNGSVWTKCACGQIFSGGRKSIQCCVNTARSL